MRKLLAGLPLAVLLCAGGAVAQEDCAFCWEVQCVWGTFAPYHECEEYPDACAAWDECWSPEMAMAVTATGVLATAVLEPDSAAATGRSAGAFRATERACKGVVLRWAIRNAEALKGEHPDILLR